MTGFLTLPGEIRNRIYTHIFPERQVLLRCARHEKALTSTSGRRKEEPRRRPAQLCALSPHDMGHLQQPLRLSPQLLRVCRQVYEETLPLLYTIVAFRLESMKAINCFLNGACGQGVEQITKLAITQSGYGEPLLTSDTDWKAKHDQRWMSTCKRIANKMKGLQHLKLCLQICDWPCQLNLGAEWAKPLFFLKGPDGLERVNIYLHSSNFPEKRLEATARVVEQAMMNAQGRAQRQLESSLHEITRLEEKQHHTQLERQSLRNTIKATLGARCKMEMEKPKARKVLNIRMGQDQETSPHKAKTGYVKS